MPLYEFKCVNEKCKNYGIHIEALMTIKEHEVSKDRTKCSLCKQSMQPLISGPLLKFRGPGFYVNDKNK